MKPDIICRVMRFFSAEVLSVYQSQGNKYDVNTDYFTGEIQTSSSFYENIAQHTGKNSISVKFGYHARKDGDLALAVYMPDLLRASEDERSKWEGFQLPEDQLSAEPDRRFEMWVKVYLDGDWDVGEPVLARLRRLIDEINAVTSMVLTRPLFKYENNSSLRFLAAETDHAYQDAHAEAYKYLVDGLDKETVKSIGARAGVTLNVASDRTLDALGKVLQPSVKDTVIDPFQHVISAQRRLAGHGVRPQAVQLNAFERFNDDMESIATALKVMRDDLAQTCKVTVESCVARAEAMKHLTQIDLANPVQPHYSISQVGSVEGKTISRAEFGFARKRPGAAEREAIILHFTDGSSVGIDMASNLGQLLSSERPIEMEEHHLSYFITLVPPLLKP